MLLLLPFLFAGHLVSALNAGRTTYQAPPGLAARQPAPITPTLEAMVRRAVGDTLYCTSALVLETINGTNYTPLALTNGPWCFTGAIPSSRAIMLATANPIMKEVYRQAVLTGLDVQDTLQSPNDGYATRFNGTALNAVCEYYGYTRQTEECFQFVFWELSFQYLVRVSNLQSWLTCTDPGEGFLPEYTIRDTSSPTNSTCMFDCSETRERCGAPLPSSHSTYCIDPNTQLCVSGMPVPKVRRKRSECASGFTSCAVPWSGGFECLDTNTNLEVCGACPGAAVSTARPSLVSVTLGALRASASRAAATLGTCSSTGFVSPGSRPLELLARAAC